MNSVLSKSNHMSNSNKSTLPLPSLSTSSQYLYIFLRSLSGIFNSSMSTLKPLRMAGVCGNSGSCSLEQHRCRNRTRSNRFGLCGFFTGMSCRSEAWNLSYCLAVSRVSQTTRFPYIFVFELFPAKTSGSPPPWTMIGSRGGGVTLVGQPFGSLLLVGQPLRPLRLTGCAPASVAWAVPRACLRLAWGVCRLVCALCFTTLSLAWLGPAWPSAY